jgi:hypothetical protein
MAKTTIPFDKLGSFFGIDQAKKQHKERLDFDLYKEVKSLFLEQGLFGDYNPESWSKLNLKNFGIMSSEFVRFDYGIILRHFNKHKNEFPELKKTFQYENYAKSIVDSFTNKLDENKIIVPSRPEKKEKRIILYDLDSNDFLVLGDLTKSNQWEFVSLYKMQLSVERKTELKSLYDYISFHKFLLSSNLYMQNSSAETKIEERLKVAETLQEKNCIINGTKYSPNYAANILALRELEL